MVGAYGEGGAEGVEAVLGGVPGGFRQAAGVAVAAAAVDVAAHRLHEGPQAVLVLHHQLQADGLGVVGEAVAAGAVLGEGVDVGVVPKARGLDALGAQLLDAGHRAGGTADVEQEFHGWGLLLGMGIL